MGMGDKIGLQSRSIDYLILRTVWASDNISEALYIIDKIRSQLYNMDSEEFESLKAEGCRNWGVPK